MTLLRQLVLVIVTLFILLFAGAWTISVRNTQEYLSSQLRTISQDTATSLGLTLSPHFASNEMIIVESMTSAVFDSGYYREVSIRSIDGKPIIEKTAPVRIEGVPAWFIRLVPLETPRGEALIMAGWRQAGTVSVATNPGQAYMTLWANSIESFWWFLGSSVLTFLLGLVAMHLVLRPLRAVEAQARAICDRQYPVQEELPWTLELRSVVEAMNRMTTKVRDMFVEQAEAMERMRAETYRDPLTGLANRKYFDMQLRYLIDGDEHFHTGALILLEVKDLHELNETAGYANVDALLTGVGALIQERCAALGDMHHFAAHLAGADFAVVLADIGEKDADEFADQLMNSLPRLHEQGLIATVDIAHAGIALYRSQSVTDFLSEADTALRAAQVKGPNAWHRGTGSLDAGSHPHSASHWSELLQRILAERRIVLLTQPVLRFGSGQIVDHREVLLRVLDDDNTPIPAGIFIPMVKRLGLGQAFDRLVVQEVMSRLARQASPAPRIAINLFPGSILDAGFSDWLCAELARQPGIAGQLVFEIAEYSALEDLAALKTWVDRIRATGARTSIDHFGRGFTSFGYLCETRIDYLKIDGSFITGLTQSRDHRFFVEAVANIAHGLDITVVAEAVESEEDIATLRALGIDGLQGYGVGAPSPWKAA